MRVHNIGLQFSDQSVNTKKDKRVQPLFFAKLRDGNGSVKVIFETPVFFVFKSV